MKMLMKKYEELSVLLFPCGQFGDQELKTTEEIKKFVAGRGLEGPNVHIMPKCDVKGPNIDPIWKYMKDQANAPDPQWNFTGKFVVSRDGAVSVPGKDVKADIEREHG
mmetsp:Transcript_66201/g.186419  ORF Transcript_66201/g.186419 Transcript_66201/m.186419 type:complete len:108 (-) Transcript_66201:161-484(-)